MVIAWVGFATIGMFIARYMKPVWGEKDLCGNRLWFQVCPGSVDGNSTKFFIINLLEVTYISAGFALSLISSTDI